MNIDVVIADYSNPKHGKDIIQLLNHYACDPMGGGQPLSEFVQDNLVKKLSAMPTATSLLCYVDGESAGLLNFFEGFSSFKCRPLINVHDVVVADSYRGLGISQLLFEKLETIAKERSCCKITLEVLEGNKIAQGAYLKQGFKGYELDPEMGQALFWEKTL